MAKRIITDEADSYKVCSKCLSDAFLQNHVSANGTSALCNYCNEKAICICLKELGDMVDEAFQRHYFRTAKEPDGYEMSLLCDKEIYYNWERDGEETIYAIMDSADFSEDIAKDLQAYLEEKYSDVECYQMGEETEYSTEAHYIERDIADHSEWDATWNEITALLKKKQRYFNASAQSAFKTIFRDIESLHTVDGKPLVYELGESGSTKFVFRARAFEDMKSLKEAFASPDETLGSPPHEYARAGRMNAEGISVFYGATTSEVALSEIRPPVGSYVVISKFEIVRPIHVLDLSRIRNTHPPNGSIFDPSYAELLQRIGFLRTVSDKICKPVTPFYERFEYIVTQAFSEFLESNTELSIDGVMYDSVQASSEGKNIVLLHNSSKVSLPESFKDVEFEADFCSRGDEESPEFVIEYQKKVIVDSGKSQDLFSFLREEDERPTTLHMLLDSVKVHKICGFTVNTSEFDSSMHESIDLDELNF